jgi:hypothetical protein
MVRQQCKPIQYSDKILKHIAPLWKLRLDSWNNLLTKQHHIKEHDTLHIPSTNVIMARLPNGDKTGPKAALRASIDTLGPHYYSPQPQSRGNNQKIPHPYSPPYTSPG